MLLWCLTCKQGTFSSSKTNKMTKVAVETSGVLTFDSCKNKIKRLNTRLNDRHIEQHANPSEAPD